jgi:hypothetical protein
MNGSTHSIHLALGCAAALLAGACSRPSSPPSSPSLSEGVGTSSTNERSPETTGGSNTAQPGFDSDRESQSTGQPGAMQQGEPSTDHGSGSQGQGQQGFGAAQQGAGQGASQQGAQGAQAGSPGTLGGTNGAPSALNEREACDRLTSEATLHIEQIEGGVSIVARPRRGGDLSSLRSNVQSIQRGIERGAPSSAAAQCDLFSLARTGVVAVTETPDSIRLLVTTSDASRVPQLRRQANEFLRSKGGSSSQQNGSPKSGSQKGGSQRGGGSQDQGSGSQRGGGSQDQGSGSQRGGGSQDRGGDTPQPSGGTPQGGTP